ncbi:hypothetical protein GEOBC_00608 [Geobacteraceae bacterium]|nr:hypothetical protein GEOBC_00608 [Geobacteraceae bacterium]
MTYVLVTGYKLSIKWVTLLPSILLMGLGAWFAIQAGINTYVLKLEQQFRSAYVIELGNEVTKLIGAVLMWFAGLTTAIAGIGSVAMGSLVAAILASILLEQSLDKSAETSKRKVKKYTRVLLSQLLPILPGAIHFALQGPFIAWLAAYYGTISNVAEVGALGRVAILIGLISGFAASVVIPRLTLIKDDQTFIERYLLWWGIMFLFGMAIMAAIGIYPKLFLLLLGEHYLNLNEELTISAAAAIIGSWLGFSFNVNRMRGWIRYQKWSVPLIILGQVIMFFSMSFSSTRDVLMFGFGSLLISFLFQLWLNIMGINGLRKNRGT